MSESKISESKILYQGWILIILLLFCAAMITTVLIRQSDFQNDIIDINRVTYTAIGTVTDTIYVTDTIFVTDTVYRQDIINSWSRAKMVESVPYRIHDSSCNGACNNRCDGKLVFPVVADTLFVGMLNMFTGKKDTLYYMLYWHRQYNNPDSTQVIDFENYNR